MDSGKCETGKKRMRKTNNTKRNERKGRKTLSLIIWRWGKRKEAGLPRKADP